MELKAKIEQLLGEKFKEEEFTDLFLIEIRYIEDQKKFEIFIDSDTSLTIRHCTRVNKYLHREMEALGMPLNDYLIDVSSPGVGKPLLLFRQYIKNIGRSVSVKLNDKTKLEGILKSVDDEKMILESTEKVLVGKKKKTQLVETDVLLTEVAKIIVKITF